MATGTISVLVWGSSIPNEDLEVFLQKLLAYVIRKEEQIKGVTETLLLDIMTWSLNQIAAGVFPTTDYAGIPWAAKSRRAKNGGKLLTPDGVRGVVVRLDLVVTGKIEKGRLTDREIRRGTVRGGEVEATH